MTAKRDLKRRVRQRQARTGEAYVTARRHVVAATAASADDDDDDVDAVAAESDTADTGPVRASAVPPAADVARGDAAVPTPAAPAPGSAASAAVSVVELLDVSEQARRLGLVCRVAMFPALVARVEPASVL